MSRLDLVIRGASVVQPEGYPGAGIERCDLGIAEGRIVALGPELAEPALEELDARGLLAFPGILDAHVHFNQPGRTHWEGLASGSAALAAGGGTAFFDMPLNSLPPVLDRAGLALKRAQARRFSRLDFALWGGLTPLNLDTLGELAEAGAIGFKAFLCASGVDEFPATSDPAILRRGMKRAAELGLPVAVHAEDDALAGRLLAEARARGEEDAASWLATRPVEVELLAIERACELAGETGCRLHVVHVSSPEGLAAIALARKRGVDVSAETCPHYLLLGAEDVPRLGAIAKCAPPLRDEARRQELWRRLEAGEVDTLGSDHSPSPPGLKRGGDFFRLWGGISGCQHGFPLLLSAALERAPAAQALPRMAALLAANAARRFRLDHRKGRLAPGLDADLCLLEIGSEHVLDNTDLLYRHRQGPYHGRPCRVRVVRTLSRGRTVYPGPDSAPDRQAQYLSPRPQ